MYLYPCTTKQQYLDLFWGPTFVDRYAIEWHFAWSHREVESFSFLGICKVCGRGSEFLVDRQWGVTDEQGICRPNWRERQTCITCGLNSRQRASYTFVGHYVSVAADRARTRIYLMEQVTQLYQRCRAAFADVELIGSEFIGPDRKSGTVENEIRHEDAQALSLEDSSVDILVSNDVLEHVPDPVQGFREMARVLKPGGQLYLSVPFLCEADRNTTRAEIVDGRLEHRLPPVYHGNPMSSDGSLVFTDFGWEILDQLQAAGFRSATVTIFWSYLYGHLGIPSEFIHGVK